MQRLRRRKPEHLPSSNMQEEIIEDDHERRMGFFEHLDELRQRLIHSFLAGIVGTLIGIVMTPMVLDFILEPYAALYPEGRQLYTLGPTEAVVAYFRVALMVGGILAIPIITYQVLMFILPGLKRGERRVVYLSIPPITLLFLIGVAFSWYVLMPPAISFLEGFQADIFEPEWTAAQYVRFVTALLFWMGVAFETPLVFFILSLLGLVNAMTLIKNWRVAVVGAAIASAIITPTVDPVNMGLVMVPLMGLYVLSILLVFMGRRLPGAHINGTLV